MYLVVYTIIWFLKFHLPHGIRQLDALVFIELLVVADVEFGCVESGRVVGGI